MSQSSAHEGDFERHAPDEAPEHTARDSAAPSNTPGETPDGAVNAALDAELSDHLAAAAADLVRRGEAEETAARLALEQFGDIARIKRQCWWIQKGDEVMFRTVGIGLLSLLTVAVVAVALGGWQVQRNLASRTEELSGQLASLTSTQQAMLAQQRPPEITGLCYLGDRSKPAADVEIKVYRFPESGSTAGARGVIVGMERTDMDGHFKTGPLQYGDYCLLVALRAPPGEADELLLFKEIQTKPVSLAPGCGVVQSDVDVLASGRVELSAAAQVANIGKRDDGNDLKDRIVLNLLSGAEDKPVRAFDSDYLDGRTPISKWPVPMHFRQAPFAVSSLPRTWWLPPRTYAGGAYLQLNKNATAERGRFGYPQGEFVGSIGTAAHVEVPVTANETTTLRLTLPEGFAEDEFKTALPQPALPSGFFATGTVGALASKIKLKLQVEPAEKSAP